MLVSWRLVLATLIAGSQLLPAQSNSIALTAPGSLTISAAVAGSQPITQSDQTARYSVTVVGTRVKITAHVDTPPPTGVTLTISLAAPAGAVSLGSVVLSGSPQDVVRYVSAGQYTSLTVTLSLTATVTAGVVPFNTSHVVITLADDP